jgi:hypothetical protein
MLGGVKLSGPNVFFGRSGILLQQLRDLHAGGELAQEMRSADDGLSDHHLRIRGNSIE